MSRTGRDFAMRLNAAEILDKPTLSWGEKQKVGEPPTTCPGRYQENLLRPGGRLPPIASLTSRPAEQKEQNQAQQPSAYEEALVRKKEKRRKRKAAMKARIQQRIEEEESEPPYSPEPEVERFSNSNSNGNSNGDVDGFAEVEDPELERGVCGTAVRYTTPFRSRNPCLPSKSGQGQGHHDGYGGYDSNTEDGESDENSEDEDGDEDQQVYVDDNAVTFVVDGMGVVQAQPKVGDSGSNTSKNAMGMKMGMGMGLGALGPQAEYSVFSGGNSSYVESLLATDDLNVQEPDLSAKPKFCPATEMLHELNR
jgi:hypothetical protein